MDEYIMQKIIKDELDGVVQNRQPDMSGFEMSVDAQPIDPLLKITEKLQNARMEQDALNAQNNVTREIEEDVQPAEGAPSTYENIMREIQQHEEGMERAIKEADELSKEVKDSIMYFLDIRKPNKNGILMNGVPDVLQASARLLDLAINGRYKLASMKKLRASILKDMTAKGGSDELSLADLLK